VSSDSSRVRLHVYPAIGSMPIARVTRDQVERLVEALDAKVRAGGMSWKNAANVWGLVTKMFADAQSAKRRDLRARDDNPTTGVRGPDRGAHKAKQYLYPSEFTTLVGCAELPYSWRALYAIAVGTFARAGEIEALTWDDVDLDHGTIHITKAIDRHSGRVKSTKTGETRRIPIERTLSPLLHKLREEATGAQCVKMPPDEIRATTLRVHLERAGVRRRELFITDAARKQITFHDLRATGITWCAVRGDEPLRIKQRAGHSSFSTTEGYIREAENLVHGFGEPFPMLPADLIETPQGVSDQVPAFRRRRPPISAGILRREGDSNPW